MPDGAGGAVARFRQIIVRRLLIITHSMVWISSASCGLRNFPVIGGRFFLGVRVCCGVVCLCLRSGGEIGRLGGRGGEGVIILNLILIGGDATRPGSDWPSPRSLIHSGAARREWSTKMKRVAMAIS